MFELITTYNALDCFPAEDSNDRKIVAESANTAPSTHDVPTTLLTYNVKDFLGIDHDRYDIITSVLHDLDKKLIINSPFEYLIALFPDFVTKFFELKNKIQSHPEQTK